MAFSPFTGILGSVRHNQIGVCVGIAGAQRATGGHLCDLLAGRHARAVPGSTQLTSGCARRRRPWVA